jgi:hypothetical protein
MVTVFVTASLAACLGLNKVSDMVGQRDWLKKVIGWKIIQ